MLSELPYGFEWRLRNQRERVRKAIADRTLVTPHQVYAAISPARAYDAEVAEVICGHLAALSFDRRDDGTWSHQA